MNKNLIKRLKKYKKISTDEQLIQDAIDRIKYQEGVLRRYEKQKDNNMFNVMGVM